MKLKFSKLAILTLSTLMLGGASYVGYNLLAKNNDQNIEDTGLTISNKTNIKMTYVSDTSYRLTATVEPSNAAYKDVSWSLYWKNDSSTFAKGKDPYDYISITQTSSDKLTILLECLQEFGETIVVKVASVYNEDAYATCDIDYGRKVQEVTAYLNGKSTDGQVIEDNSLIELTADVTYNDSYTYNTLYEYTFEYEPLSNYNVDSVSERGTYNLSIVNVYIKTLLNTGKKYSQADFIAYLEQNVTSYGSISKSRPYYGDVEFLPVQEVTQDEFINVLNSTYFTFRATVSDVSDTIKCKFNFSPTVSSLSLSTDNILF